MKRIRFLFSNEINQGKERVFQRLALDAFGTIQDLASHWIFNIG
jgi:hypothetical protein